MPVVSVSMPDSLLSELDDHGYSGRSELERMGHQQDGGDRAESPP